MLIHARLSETRVNGPGKRAIIWVQGCLLNCPGCFNTETHNPNPGHPCWEDNEYLAKWIETEARANNLEGLTWSGGEPMHQAQNVLAVSQQVREAIPNFSIGMFTGYSLKELEAGQYQTLCITEEGKAVIETSANKPYTSKVATWNLLSTYYLDFAIMGRYMRGRPDNRPLSSSTNQEFRLFSNRYTLADFTQQQTEITIDETGLVQVTGFPAPNFDLVREV